MDRFSLREAQYPLTDEDKNALDDMRRESVFISSLYSELPGMDTVPPDQLIVIASHKLYISYVYTLAEMKRDCIAARKSTDESPTTAAMETDDTLLSVDHEDVLGTVWEKGVDDDMPGVSLTDPTGVDLLMPRHNLVASFCKTGSTDCPNSLFAMESAQEVFNDHHLNITFRFLVVECDSVEDLRRYKLRLFSLPSYALYNNSREMWTVGKKKSDYYWNIVSLIAGETNHREITEVFREEDETLRRLQTSKKKHTPHNEEDEDIYTLMGRPFPYPSLPSGLVLTDKNFSKKIMMFEKTAVLFYLRWSAESKVVLPHLIAAWERLDNSLNVSLGCLDCYSHTNLCYHFNVTSLPVLLLFTPSTLDTPSAPPSSIGVLDSTHFLQVLGQPSKQPVGALMEATPTSLPTLLKNKLTTPLVLWCDNKPVSPLGLMFSIAALNNKFNSELAFAWMNSSEHSNLLNSALALDSDNFPTVIAMHLSQGVAYQMEAVSGLQADIFGEHLLTFLDELMLGKLKPAKRLSQRTWHPLYPAFQFPSKPRSQNSTQKATAIGEEGGVGGHQEMIEEPDMESTVPPHDEPPQLKDTKEERKKKREKLSQNKEEL